MVKCFFFQQISYLLKTPQNSQNDFKSSVYVHLKEFPSGNNRPYIKLSIMICFDSLLASQTSRYCFTRNLYQQTIRYSAFEDTTNPQYDCI